MRAVWLAVALVVALTQACYVRPSTEGAPCKRDADCDDRQLCVAEVCTVPEDDDGGALADTDTDGGSSSGEGAGDEP